MLPGILALALLGNPAPAQDAEISQTDAPAVFSSRVNLVMVPVVARDRNGRAVGNLTKENFQLFDRGRPQVITRFLLEKESERAKPVDIASDDPDGPKPEAAAPAKGAVIPGRFLAFVFDDMHMQFGDLAQARKAALAYLAESLRPDERVAVFTTTGRVALDFTDEPGRAAEAMNRILPKVADTHNECPPISFYQADLIVNHNDANALQLASVDALACTNTNDLPLPATRDGPSPNATQIAGENTDARALARSAAASVVARGEQDSRIALDALKEMARRMASAPGERTMILVSGGFFLTDFERREEAEMIDASIRSNVTINSLDARGLYTIVPGGDATQSTYNRSNGGTANTLRANLAHTENVAIGEVLSELADGTGGIVFQGSNDLKDGFARAATAPEFIYLLGFSPENLKLDGTYHTLSVSLTPKNDLSLIARRGYWAPRHEADETELALEEIREALYSRQEIQDIPMLLQTQFFKTEDQKAKLSVVARIDLKPLHFKKEDGRNKNLLVMVAGAFDTNGKLVAQVRRNVEMRLRDETFEVRVTSPITVKGTLDVTPGNYVVRVVLRDQEGRMMTTRNRVVDIPY